MNQAANEDALSLEGTVADVSTWPKKCQAIDLAFDYRGDITLTLETGETVAGYLANRNAEAQDPFVELMIKETDSTRTIRYREITGLAFTGRDAASGKSWESWLNKVAEAEANGVIAELYPDDAP